MTSKSREVELLGPSNHGVARARGDHVVALQRADRNGVEAARRALSLELVTECFRHVAIEVDQVILLMASTKSVIPSNRARHPRMAPHCTLTPCRAATSRMATPPSRRRSPCCACTARAPRVGRMNFRRAVAK